MLPLWARVDIGAIAMNGYSAFSKGTLHSPSDCFVSYAGHSGGGLTPQLRSSRCILNRQPTGQNLRSDSIAKQGLKIFAAIAVRVMPL